jgi:Spy/CpxP family protein refolding chaperone
MKKHFIFALTAGMCVAVAQFAWAQHDHAPAAGSSPYAGEQNRGIKALSDKEITSILQGQGMGLAKAAELNGYPGPMHVLEHARRLGLTDEQRATTKALFDAHKSEVKNLGAKLIEAERALDQAFASKQIDEVQLQTRIETIARLQGEIRASHLVTHLKQTALLSNQQVALYAQLRGYRSPDSLIERN